MIVVHFNLYADFLAAVKEMKPLHVFYQPVSGSSLFGVQVYVENKNLICGFADTVAPSTFNADFPQAITMTVLPGLNQASGQQF